MCTVFSSMSEYPNHSQQLCDHLCRMYTKQELCDVYIQCPDDQSVIPCHSCVLAAASPIIKEKLNKNNIYATWTKLSLQCFAVSRPLWLHVLRFMYTGINTIPDELLSNAMLVAKFLNMRDLEFMVQQKLNLISSTPPVTVEGIGPLTVKPFHLAQLDELQRSTPAVVDVDTSLQNHHETADKNGSGSKHPLDHNTSEMTEAEAQDMSTGMIHWPLTPLPTFIPYPEHPLPPHHHPVIIRPTVTLPNLYPFS